MRWIPMGIVELQHASRLLRGIAVQQGSENAVVNVEAGGGFTLVRENT